MQSSFRASKLILGKVGTAASFGFGLNVGARYSDSQSGHRFAIEEARALSRPCVDVDLDVDRRSLFGYSCFSASSSSHATEPSRAFRVKASPELASVEQRDDSSHETSTETHTTTATERVRDSAGSESASMRRRSSTLFPAAPHLSPSKLVRKQATETQAVVLRAVQKSVEKEDDSKTNWGICDGAQPNHEPSTPRPLPQSCPAPHHLEQQDEVTTTCSVAHSVKQPHYRNMLTWEGLIEKDQCSLCCDLLAVPVRTPCQHSFCGVCFHELRLYHRHTGNPLDCPNCRMPLAEEQSLDTAADARIAATVDVFVQQQRGRLTEAGGEQTMAGGREYADWLERREKYFVSTLPPRSSAPWSCSEVLAEAQGSQVGGDIDEELDDLPAWSLPESTGDNPRGTIDSQEASGTAAGHVAALFGAGVAAWLCMLLLCPRPTPTSCSEGVGVSVSEGGKSVLRDLAGLLCAAGRRI